MKYKLAFALHSTAFFLFFLILGASLLDRPMGLGGLPLAIFAFPLLFVGTTITFVGLSFDLFRKREEASDLQIKSNRNAAVAAVVMSCIFILGQMILMLY